MFDNYYDEVTYEKKSNADKFGNLSYDVPIKVKVRYVKGYDIYQVDKDKTSTKYKRTYHVPFEITDGDKLNGRIITDVKPCRGIGGNVHYWKVVVM